MFLRETTTNRNLLGVQDGIDNIECGLFSIYKGRESAFAAGLPVKVPLWNHLLSTLRTVVERVLKNPCV